MTNTLHPDRNDYRGSDNEAVGKNECLQASETKLAAPQAPANSSAPRKRIAWCLRSLFHAGLVVGSGLLLIAAVGVAQRLGWISAGGSTQSQTDASTAESQRTQQTSYVCPMMCTPPHTKPGRCPVCGMELVPVQDDGSDSSDELTIDLNPVARRLANIEVAPVQVTTLHRTIHTVGEIAFDESRQATIAAYVDGRIEKLFADYTGIDVQAGERMVLLYSPELYAAEVEYLVSRGSKEGRGLRVDGRGQEEAIGETDVKPVSGFWTLQSGLAEDALEKLRELGMTQTQIAELEKRGQAETRLEICAPIGGTVIKKVKQEGDYVKTGEPICRISDLSTVWLMLELFPEDAAQIRFAQKVDVTVESLLDEVFTGRVAFVDPVVNQKTRTVGVRVEMVNPQRRLRPGDYATARIQVPVSRTDCVFDAELAGKWIDQRHPRIVSDKPGSCPLCGTQLVRTSQFGYADALGAEHTVLTIPRDAVLMTGSNSVVYVETEPGHFQIRPVTLGPLSEESAVIIRGLAAGEQVARSGNFLIDSQMQLTGRPSLIDPARALAKSSETQDPGKTPASLASESAASPIPQIARLAGATGKALDQLFDAYFGIQHSLAADEKPSLSHVAELHAAAEQLSNAADLPVDAGSEIQPILTAASALAAADLGEARKQFKPISHAAIRLASQARGPETAIPFVHFLCPMVPGGGGDWLQAGGELVNPYFGSQMLHCGRKVEDLSVPGRVDRIATRSRAQSPDSRER